MVGEALLFAQCVVDSMNKKMLHRILEWPGLEKTTVLISFQPLCCVQGRQPAVQTAQRTP